MKKVLSLVLALVMALSLCSVSWAADESYYAEIGSEKFETLQAAVNAVEDGKETTIKLIDNISNLSTDAIVTIPAGKVIVLDMNDHSITVSTDFTGRPIVNGGTLTVRGNGTIDSSASETGGYGAINNMGTLHIIDGTYSGSLKASGAAIRNTGASAVLVVENGLFEKATCAVYNEGSATINGGKFIGTSCSSCNSNIFSYTVRNVAVNAVMEINGGEVIGTQGAVGAAAGKLTVNNGSFKTVDCANKHGAIFYALYAAGEVGEVETIINGGTFETEGKYTAVLIGNDNKNGDGGINAKSTAQINGGTFIAPNNVPAVKKATETGDLSLSGGTFSSDVKDLTQETTPIATTGTGESTKFHVGSDSIVEAAKETKDITVVQGTSISGLPNDTKVTNGTGGEITVNGNKVEKDKTYTVPTKTSGGYYYHPSTPGITAELNGTNKSATDYPGGDYGLVFRSTAAFSTFQGVQVDGKTLAKSNYTAEEGSTVVYLKAAYLKTLAAGKHTITILSTAGNTSMDFTIGGKSSSPQTFDAGVGIYAVTAVLSMTGMAWTAKKRH